jgi:transcription termination/antitermination protein NusA
MSEMMEALQALAAEKGISVDTLMAALADALESAYKRMPGAHEYAWVTIDPANFDIRVYAQEIDEDGEPYGPELDVTPKDFGRIAAQTARQVMTQRIREAERELRYEEYAGREGDIVTGTVQQGDSRYTLLSLGPVEALLPQAEQVPHERPEANTRLKAYIVEVRRTSKGPQIVVSRTHPGLVLELFKLEVPEIADGVVEIKACAREPGHRTKIAVWSNDNNVDPVGACVGARGARVRQVVNELRGEKIDIVPFSDDPYEFVAKALSPAKVKEVRIDEAAGVAEVIVPDYQLSLAIGKEGQNARLSARLTGWRVDIKSETQLVEEEAYSQQDWAEGEWVVNPDTGEQVWQPAEGGPALSVEDWEAGAAEGEPGEARRKRRLVPSQAGLARRRPDPRRKRRLVPSRARPTRRASTMRRSRTATEQRTWEPTTRRSRTATQERTWEPTTGRSSTASGQTRPSSTASGHYGPGSTAGGQTRPGSTAGGQTRTSSTARGQTRTSSAARGGSAVEGGEDRGVEGWRSGRADPDLCRLPAEGTAV